MNKENLELYIHIPFCVKKCAYCDFLSGPCTRDRQREYFKALEQEIRAAAPHMQGKKVSTVFFGGGTPSIAGVRELSEIMVLLTSAFSFTENPEITIESNPGTLTLHKLKDYLNMGINRLSLGCQSADNEELVRLGRIHTFEEFLDSYEMAREAGFSNINVDLMCALPGQTLKSWEDTLGKILNLQPEHISAYSLIVEEGTPFSSMELELPDEDTERAMYNRTGELLAAQGYARYEISNYAREGFACRHNLGYWRRENYLGLGLGAASLVDEVRFSNERDMDRYLKCSSDLSVLYQERQVLSRKEQMEETMFLGLRTMDGVSKKDFRRYFGIDMEEVYGPVLEKYSSTGFLYQDEDHVCLTCEGIPVSNVILADFLLD